MAQGKGSSYPFLVFYGGEDFLLDRDMDKARRWDGRSITLLDGIGMTDHELVSICCRNSMDGTARVVILDEAQKVKGDKALKNYIEDKDPSDLSVVLVAIVRSEKLSDVWSKAAQKGRSVERRKLKTWDNNNEVVAWIEQEASRLKVKLAKGVAAVLYEHVGGDLYRLASEIQKIALIAGEGNEAGAAHLKLTIAPTPSVEPWQVAEAAVAKDKRKAMNLLSLLYKTQGDEVNVPLVSSLMRQVEKLLVARQMINKGVSDDELAAYMGMKPFRCKHFFLPVVQKHGIVALVEHMTRLCQLDVDVKGSSKSKRTLVELAVLSISG